VALPNTSIYPVIADSVAVERALAIGRARVTTTIAVAAGIATFAYRYLSFEYFPNDHFAHLAAAQQMTFGAMPVRDFAEDGWPLAEALSAGAQIVLGRGLHAEVILVAAAFAIATALLVAVAVRISGSTLLGVLASAVPVLAYPISYSYPKLLPYAATLLVLWWYAARPTRLRLALLGASIGVAFLFRHDHGVLLGAGVASGLVALDGTRSPRTIGQVAAIALIVVSPYLLWVQAYEGLITYFRDGVAYSERESSKARWTPPSFSLDRTRPLFDTLGENKPPIVNVRWAPNVSLEEIARLEAGHGLTRGDNVGERTWQYELSRWSSADLEAIVRDPGVADTNGIDRGRFSLKNPPSVLDEIAGHIYVPGNGLRLDDNSVTATYYLIWLLAFAAALMLVPRWRVEPAAVRTVVVAAIALQLMMNWTMLRDPLATRVKDVLAPSVVLLAYFAARLWERAQRTSATVVRRTAVALVIAFALTATAIAGQANEQLQAAGITRGWSGVAQAAATLRQDLAPPHEHDGRVRTYLMPIVSYLESCTPPDSRLFTVTFAPQLFFYTERAFAGGRPSLIEGFYKGDREETLMLERLAHEDVPFVITDDESTPIARQYPRLMASVNKRYREVARLPASAGGDKTFIVMADVTRPPVRRFGDQQLPCFRGPS
jgi:hypothetical protein